MLKETLKNARKLRKSDLKAITGGNMETFDLSLCGCDCRGVVTGPKECSDHMACLQVYTCGTTES
ncbi:natural product precursor [Chryseobacterium defluvii]|uniref:Natural product n=1 Tax=Chryseobacterium defluvii TaxID=160396 RepID=A0A840K7D7_9FLAO|nr:hypothetical protein [Chryseobacterium defluvii]MBB4805126.1 natural product precursor [Chryseobacterium defluvii]